MFDLGWSELLLIAAVGLIVIGPKDLPQAIRTVSQIIRKLRGMARDFQSGLDEIAREAGVDEIKRDLQDFGEEYDPRAALENIADEDRELSQTFGDIEESGDGNRIEAPKTDEREDPPDLTAADFGASDETASAADGEPAEAEPAGEEPVERKPDSGAA